MRRRARNRSESLPTAEDPAPPLSTAAIRHQSSLTSLSVESHRNAPPLPTVAHAPPDASHRTPSTKEQPRLGILNRISLRHKRRSATAQGRRGSGSRTYNSNYQ